MTEARRGWVVVAMLAVAALGAWLLYAMGPNATMETHGPGTPATTSGRAASPDPGEAPKMAASEEEEKARTREPLPEAKARSNSRIPESTRPFESPEAASAFVESKVVGLLAEIAPEVNPKELERTCEPDGRICTFVGPWPGDDLLRHWIKAVSDHRTGPEQLDGVMFSQFAPFDDDGVRRLRIVAHAP